MNITEDVNRFLDYALFEQQVLCPISWSSISAVLGISPSETLCTELGRGIQQRLDTIDINNVTPRIEFLIYHLIALIPFIYPKEGANFNLPVKKQEQWCKVDFKVKKIFNATIIPLFSPLKAYSLESTGPQIDSLLLHTGTTWGSGCVNSILADFTPFSSVGTRLFDSFKPELDTYFSTHNQVTVYGISLGGALTLHTLKYYSDKISQAVAIVPPGLLPWNNFECRVAPTIVVHSGDLVSHLGTFPENANINRLTIPGNSILGIQAHARIFSGNQNVDIKSIDSKEENKKLFRRILTVIHFALGWIVFIFVALGAGLCVFVKFTVQTAARGISFIYTGLASLPRSCPVLRLTVPF